ncbi:ATP-binding protein [Bermanella sp. WJH001]|uniref:ATP-binding protein n=1 Tax=Bermanella sp. WJH001 TaxID=3048005 RepID=UPI0024BEEC32|nr:ATP-binding protein [Bermanella sp. WJH001]MDJ1539015.1 ATP-binding protein [Bermanella sp. WJH001]
MRQWYARLGFGAKIQLTINIVSISVLTLAIVVIGLGFYGEFKRNLEHRVLQKSNLLADAAAVGVVFDQPESVNMLLSSLTVDEGVKTAIVYKKYGPADYRYFSHYEKEGLKQTDFSYEHGPVQEWRNGEFILRLPILVDSEEVGRLSLTEDDNYLASFGFNILKYMIPVLLVSLLVVWILSRSLQSKLAAPLNDLTKAVHEVAYNQDYDRHVKIVSDDELGELGSAFNLMLSKLSEHEEFRTEKELEIVELNAELENKVYERTKELETSLANLQVTQDQLVEQEKMASLGELVAGVAHEINTPIGVGITAVSHLVESIDRINKAFNGGTLTKKQFSDMLSAILESAGIVESNLRRAADLVKAFKAVAIDQSSAEPRLFALGSYIQDILTSLRPKLKRTHHAIQIDIPEELDLYCDPGVISQIITNLIMNSLNHAFSPEEVGVISIRARLTEEQLKLTYEDNGQGIDQSILKRLFDPFVTTKRGQGGSGLGTHIIYNLVTQALGGRIQCVSEPNKGTRFEITLPLENITPVNH